MCQYDTMLVPANMSQCILQQFTWIKLAHICVCVLVHEYVHRSALCISTYEHMAAYISVQWNICSCRTKKMFIFDIGLFFLFTCTPCSHTHTHVHHAFTHTQTHTHTNGQASHAHIQNRSLAPHSSVHLRMSVCLYVCMHILYIYIIYDTEVWIPTATTVTPAKMEALPRRMPWGQLIQSKKGTQSPSKLLVNGGMWDGRTGGALCWCVFVCRVICA